MDRQILERDDDNMIGFVARVLGMGAGIAGVARLIVGVELDRVPVVQCIVGFVVMNGARARVASRSLGPIVWGERHWRRIVRTLLRVVLVILAVGCSSMAAMPTAADAGQPEPVEAALLHDASAALDAPTQEKAGAACLGMGPPRTCSQPGQVCPGLFYECAPADGVPVFTTS